MNEMINTAKFSFHKSLHTWEKVFIKKDNHVI